MENLKRLVVVQIINHAWSGRGKLRHEDLGANIKVPPETLATLGSKRLYPKEKLRIFDALSKRAERRCLVRGVRFLQGFVIPKDKAAELATELDAIRKEFNEAVETFAQEFADTLASWKEQWPDWPGIIDIDANASTLKRRFGFECPMYEVSATDAVPERFNPLGASVDAIATTLLTDISQAAGELLAKSVKGKKKVTRHAINALVRIADKAEGLQFLTSKAVNLVADARAIVAGLPQTGDIEGRQCQSVERLLESMVAAGKGVFDTQSTPKGQKVVIGVRNRQQKSASPTVWF